MKNDLPGHGLRDIRERMGMTLKDVEAQSRRISEEKQNQEYVFTAGRLSQVENSFSLPSLYKLAALSQIYRTPYEELLRLYGIEVSDGSKGGASGNGAGGEAGKPQEASLTPAHAWA